MYLTGSASFERLLEVIVLFNEGVVIGEYCEDARVNTLITSPKNHLNFGFTCQVTIWLYSIIW